MWLYLTERLDVGWRSLMGALSLHAIVYALVLTTPFELEASERSVVPIVLVERSEPAEEAPIPIVERLEEAEEATGEPDIPPSEESTEITPEEPAPQLPPDPSTVSTELLRPPVPTVEPSLEDTDDSEAREEAIVIDPRYKIPFDPFAETAPTAMSRVVVAMTCARSSAAARPEFCPDITDEERYYVTFNAPSEWGEPTYDPVFDVVVAQSILEGEIQDFFANQAKHGTRSGSAELERIVDPKVANHAEGLQNCSAVL
ncbi:MAG: hypothetical protein AAFY34_07930, partial [Pseudomonadota bacterium]